eukprot:1162101-Pelagomonas_calceolata.AAC.4
MRSAHFLQQISGNAHDQVCRRMHSALWQMHALSCGCMRSAHLLQQRSVAMLMKRTTPPPLSCLPCRTAGAVSRQAAPAAGLSMAYVHIEDASRQA